MKLIQYFKSLNFAITLCLMAMATQAYHSYYTFINISNIEGFMSHVQSLLFVFTFEFFTLFYLVRGKKAMALFYSTCYLIMNIFYYYNSLSGGKLVTALFLSFIIPVSIYNVAEEVSKAEPEPEPAIDPTIELQNEIEYWKTHGEVIKNNSDGEIARLKNELEFEKKVNAQLEEKLLTGTVAGKVIKKTQNELL